MIIGVPFFAVLYAMIRRITNRLLKKRGLPTETDKYMKVDYIDEKTFVAIEEKSEPTAFFKLKKKVSFSKNSDKDEK